MAPVLPPSTSRNGQRVEFSSADPTRDVHAVTGWALDRGARLDALSVARPTLEDVFLGLADGPADVPAGVPVDVPVDVEEQAP
jgi:ABC-2 type transport system ATP-binding protein